MSLVLVLVVVAGYIPTLFMISEPFTSPIKLTMLALGAYAVQVEELATTKERNRLAREIPKSLEHFLMAVNVQSETARAVLFAGRAARLWSCV